MSKKTVSRAQKEVDKKACKELADQYQKMIEDRDNKLESAREQLVESLKITADKYRTATGTMEALRVIRMVNDGKPDDMEIYEELEQARDLAARMVVEVSRLTEKAESLGYAEMDKLCEDAYEKDFVSKSFSAIELAFELMRLDLCRNVGPAAEDIVAFINRIQEELNNVSKKIEDYIEEYPEFLNMRIED